MIDFEQYRGKNIHIVHSEGYRPWLTKAKLSMRDQAALIDHFRTLKELEDRGIHYTYVDDTQNLHGVKPGENVIVGGAIWGCCVDEHLDFLATHDVNATADINLSFTGFKDKFEVSDDIR